MFAFDTSLFILFYFWTKLVNCKTNITINVNESIEIECTIEYKFLNYDDLDHYQPRINLTFYIKENNSTFKTIEEIYLNEIKDFQIDQNMTLNWKRLITYKIKPINTGENRREYVCIIIPDTLNNQDLFHDENRICRIIINVKGKFLLIWLLHLVTNGWPRNNDKFNISASLFSFDLYSI